VLLYSSGGWFSIDIDGDLKLSFDLIISNSASPGSSKYCLSAFLSLIFGDLFVLFFSI
jgi:hypothetical protein